MDHGNRFAETPRPPYYAVIFSSRVSGVDAAGYEQMADRMIELASQQDGYLGIETTRDHDGVGITVSYWRDREAIRRWYDVAEHQQAQALGKSRWYDSYKVRIAYVEREYSVTHDPPG